MVAIGSSPNSFFIVIEKHQVERETEKHLFLCSLSIDLPESRWDPSRCNFEQLGAKQRYKFADFHPERIKYTVLVEVLWLMLRYVILLVTILFIITRVLIINYDYKTHNYAGRRWGFWD